MLCTAQICQFHPQAGGFLLYLKVLPELPVLEEVENLQYAEHILDEFSSIGLAKAVSDESSLHSLVFVSVDRALSLEISTKSAVMLLG